jgi:hypothetical protein
MPSRGRAPQLHGNQTFNGANIFSPVRVDASDAEWDAALLQVVTLPHFLRLAFKSAARSVQFGVVSWPHKEAHRKRR